MKTGTIVFAIAGLALASLLITRPGDKKPDNSDQEDPPKQTVKKESDTRLSKSLEGMVKKTGLETPLYVPSMPDEKEAQKLQREWAKKLNREAETTSPSGIVMVLIPPDGNVLKRPYLIGKFEVTQGEWEAVMGYNPSGFKKGRTEVAGLETSRFPVETVSWYDSVEFCNKLSGQEGLKPYYELTSVKRKPDKKHILEAEVTILGGPGYHIPTDAEWERACRAGSTKRYHFGDNDADLPEYAWFGKNSGNRTHRVGELKPNAFGLHDMHGNVWEWNEEMLTNAKTGSPEHIIRGSQWGNDAGSCAIANRGRYPPTSTHNYIGLRLARAAPMELIESGPWQAMLEPKLEAWYQHDNNQPDAISVLEMEGVTVLRLRPETMDAYLTSKKQFPNHHLRLEFQFPPGKASRFTAGPIVSAAAGFNAVILSDGTTDRNIWGAQSTEGFLDRGSIVAKGAKPEKADLKPAGTWNRLDIVRQDDSLVWYVNGRFVGAIMDIRWTKDDAKFDRAGIMLKSKQGEVLVRRIEVRDITAFRPELIEPGPWKSLFNGKDLKGFPNIWDPKKNGKAEIVTEDGAPAIRISALGLNTWLTGDFHVRFEVKSDPNHKSPGIALYRDGDLRFGGSIFDAMQPTKPMLYVSGSGCSCRKAQIQDGRIVAVGDTMNEPRNLAMRVNPSGPWLRMELIRWGNSLVYVVNGKVAGAFTDMRDIREGKEKPLGPLNIQFIAGEDGPLFLRKIEIRDINTLPPELMESVP